MADLSGGPIYEDPRPWFRTSNWIRHDAPYDHISKSQNESEQQAAHPRKDEKVIHHESFAGHHDRIRISTHNVKWRTVSSLRNVAVFLGFSIPVVILIIVIDVPRLYKHHSQYQNSKFNHCNFNGAFTPYDDPSISQWDKSGFLYITVAWGRMSFPLAKFIDVVWDTVVGRGVQALLAWTTYAISSQYLTIAIREAPVSYTTYEALAFVPPTFIRTLRLAGDLLMRRGTIARLIILWIVLSSLFVLSFSSWATAMTGYSSITYAVMKTYDGELVAWENYQVVQFTLADAWRVGVPGPVLITTGQACIADGFLKDEDKDVEESDEDGEPWEYVPANCSLFWRTVEYVNKYGLQAKQDTSSALIIDGVQHNLSAPTLNITTSYDDSSLETLSGYLTDLSNNKHISRMGFVEDISPSTSWVYQNETYPWEYVLGHASCRYSKYHDWGFSFLILFITSLLLALWSIGTYALWLYVQMRDQKQQHVYGDWGTLGIYSSSLTLAHSLRSDFGNDVLQPGMRESEIQNLVRRRGKTGVVGVREPHVVSTTTFHEETAACAVLDREVRGSLITPHSSGALKNAWNRMKALLWPGYLSAVPSLPCQSAVSSQTHILHSSKGTSPMDSSSLAPIISQSTTFNYSAAIPASDPPGLGTDLTPSTSRISSKPGRLGLWPNNSAGVRSCSYSSASSRGDPAALDRQTTMSWQVSSTPNDAPSLQGMSRMSRSSSTRNVPGKEVAVNALEYRNDLGDD